MAAGTLVHAGPRRVAIIDWAVLETVLALGLTPMAATELIQFRKIVVEPEVPAGVADLGLRGAPNYELLRILGPDIILISNFYEPKRRQFERIAAVHSLPVYQPSEPPYRLAVDAVSTLGELLGRHDAAQHYLAETEAELERLRQGLSSNAVRRAFVIMMGDTRHLQAFGHDSMFGEVMQRLGIANAWTHDTRYSAAAPVGVEALAQAPDAAIVIVSPLPPEFQRTQASNAIWQALPAVQRGQVAVIPSVNHFGGLPSARRFARLFEGAIRNMGRVRHE
ncbi:ABC transporter substrate-binding protein [Hyphomicrobium sp.]|uniref:ABC transporter substrate-binding protein n=1 Tax=Hyphomicrobium sp. TaxID=82 RepID=UPI0025BA7087|nr:ABC transporter substrate-binding protein [Hyphomicrobium sp.]MCC7250271.1 ABC transporter substrate-binding protein [Hyphomicrobium sp.]